MNEKTLVIQSDGGSRGNPGPAAYGFVAVLNGKIIAKSGKYIGEATNNVAEYKGVIASLDWIKKNLDKFDFNNINFFIDSELITKQLGGEYKVKSKQLKPLYIKTKALIKRIETPIKISHVKRENNRLADHLVNKYLDKESSK